MLTADASADQSPVVAPPCDRTLRDRGVAAGEWKEPRREDRELGGRSARGTAGLPAQLGYGVGDDPVAVEERDALVRAYDALYSKGGWTRTRLEMKVAGDPLTPSTQRQLLLVFGAVAVFVVWRFTGLGLGARDSGRAESLEPRAESREPCPR